MSDSSEPRRTLGNIPGASLNNSHATNSKIGYFSSIQAGQHGKLRRLEEINAIYKQASSESTFGLTPMDNRVGGLSQNGFEEIQKVGLEKIILNRMTVRGQYLYFLSTLIWFSIYVCSAYFQNIDIRVANMVTRSTMNSLVFDIFARGAGSYGYTESKLGTLNFLQSEEDVLSWINESIIERVFVDVICGDGICSESEIPGFGRFGCAADCGSFQNVTPITVDVTSFMKSKPVINLNKWDISHVIPSMKADPRFRWNIYSESLGEYIFLGDREEGQVTVDLLDGVYWFELFQTGQTSLNISAEDMYLNGYIVAGTVPKREAQTAYKYGDYREFLSTTISMLDAMYNYCYSSDVPRNLDGTEDMECRTFFDKSFQVRAMSGYGLSGSITRKNGNQPPVEIVTVPYCGVYPNGSLGLGGMRRVWEGIEIVDRWVTTGDQGGADLNLPIWMDAAVPCTSGIDQATVNNMYRALDEEVSPGRRRRRSEHQARPPPSLTRRPATSAMRRFDPNGSSRSGKLGSSTSRVDPQLEELSMRKIARRAGTNASLHSPHVLVSVSGPASRLGGPGYDEGIFWAEIHIELRDADAAVVTNATIRYSVDGTPVNCSGNGGALYTGPTLVTTLGGTGMVSASACVGSTLIATGKSEPVVLVEGPHVTITIMEDYAAGDLSLRPSTLASQLPETLCGVLSILDFCADRIAVVSEPSAGTLTASILAATNAEAGSWRQLLVLNASILQHYLPTSQARNVSVTDVRVTVPVPLHKRHHSWQFCTSHYDCAVVAPSRIGTKINETAPEDLPWGAGFCAGYGSRLSDGRAPTCDYCQLYCMIDSIDSFDGVCPEHCGNYFSGKLPACISAQKLRRTYSCTDRHRFELRQFTNGGEDIPDPRKDKMNVLRSLTPSNNLIGGVILTQYRIPVGLCPPSSTDGMNGFTNLHSVRCADMSSMENSPFGVDPAFAVSSTLFDGKHTPDEFYNFSTEVFMSGQAGATTVTPYGFFPHQWDCTRGSVKNISQIWRKSVDEFKLYFDGRLSYDQAQKLLKYMQDGRYFDVSTSRFKVEMITYNAEVKLFAMWTFVFDWERTGDITWDYALQIVNLESEDSTMNMFISGLALSFLALHLAVELRRVYLDFISMRLGKYLYSVYNILDWLNFAIQAVAWQYWYEIRAKVSSFEMDESSYVLADPQATFRPFATDPEQEYKLLELIDKVSKLGDLQGYHSSFAGISIILFVLKMIASLDFQPKMGLITRTLARAGSNLTHYLALYFLVFVGYAIVGNLMFGSLYTGMATLSMTCQTLMFFMLAFDPTQFYSQMNHAITHRQGSSIQPGTMEYNIYLWSFMFINAFILMNIFLAILVSAYDDIARLGDSSSSVLSDLWEMSTYYFKCAFWPQSHFVSDNELLAQIRKDLVVIAGSTWTETEHNARARIVQEALSTKRAILLGRGVALERKQVKALVQNVIKAKALVQPGLFRRIVGGLTQWYPVYNDQRMSQRVADCSPLGDMYERGRFRRLLSLPGPLLSKQCAAVDEVMDRLGADMRPKEKDIAKELTRLLQIEGQSRLMDISARVDNLEVSSRQTAKCLSQLVFHLGKSNPEVTEQRGPGEEAKPGSLIPFPDSLSAPRLSISHMPARDPRQVVGVLDVTVLSAAGLPKMDLFRSCDAYCMLFLNEEGDDRYADYLQYHSQTKMTRVIVSKAPAWDEHFRFSISTMTRSLVVSVWDKDVLMADDLIGCVEVQIGDMTPCQQERGAFGLVNASHASHVRDSVIFLETLYTPTPSPPETSSPLLPASPSTVRNTDSPPPSAPRTSRRANRWFVEGREDSTVNSGNIGAEYPDTTEEIDIHNKLQYLQQSQDEEVANLQLLQTAELVTS